MAKGLQPSKKITTPYFKYKRATPANLGGGVWNPIAVRKVTTEATSPRLLSYRACVASGMKAAKEGLAGKKFATIKAVQDAFKSVAAACKAKI